MGWGVGRRAFSSITSGLRALFFCAGTALVAGEPAHADPAAATTSPTPVPTTTLSPVVITGSRVEQSSFELPAAISVVDRERIRAGQARVNASEALSAVPGVVAQNRQNYAQDLQLSSRGFGARSAFGVRGVRLIADGIPASMPDGQGQLATFHLDQAERIEVMRGPFSAIYGNHAGGVIQLFSREGNGPPTLETGFLTGSDGLLKTDTSMSGSRGRVHYLLDGSHFETDGYRAHSAASRDQGMARFGIDVDADTELTFTASGLRQHDTKDPLGLDWNTARSDPRGVATAARTFDTRKSIDHLQGGIAFERRFGEDRLQITAHAGNRQVIQFQSIPKSVQQASATHSGGVIDFDRNFYGLGLRWTGVNDLADGRLTWTTGFDYEASSDERRGYENFIGSELGVKGALRRRESDDVMSADPYLQTEWKRGAWGLSAGVRFSTVRFDVDDRYASNGDDSGSVAWHEPTPVLGIVYEATPALHLYASAARGFEAPTLNELFYSGAAGGFNFDLKPARSGHLELGAKLLIGNDSRIDVALFHVRTSDELVVDRAFGGRTSYRNASRTRRSGVEVEADTTWTPGLSSHLALTHLLAEYASDFTTGAGKVDAGDRLPGVPATTVFGDLVWKHAATGMSAAVEGIYRSKVYVEDTNEKPAAPGYVIANLRVGFEQRRGGWKLEESLRLENLFDHHYIGSVIVGDTNQRYYEPAPGRTWLAGVSAAYTF